MSQTRSTLDVGGLLRTAHVLVNAIKVRLHMLANTHAKRSIKTEYKRQRGWHVRNRSTLLWADIKQLLDEVEHDIMNYQNRGLCYLSNMFR